MGASALVGTLFFWGVAFFGVLGRPGPVIRTTLIDERKMVIVEDLSIDGFFG